MSKKKYFGKKFTNGLNEYIGLSCHVCVEDLYLLLQCKTLEEKLEGLKSNQDSVSPEDRKRASQ